MERLRPYQYIILLMLLLLEWSCAQQGSPSGGPRDVDPPVVTGSEPPNYSTMFEANRIEITFDEYIVLDNVNRELIVSPPMEEQPKVKLKNKTLIIQFEEQLKDNTTYTFNFGSAIKDLHEGNKLLNFEYVFSTGEQLDSLSVKGTLRYARDLTKPGEPVSIMLYTDLRDSVPLLDIPLYVGRSDDSGVFSVNNLRSDIYKVVALKDGNNNFLFDMPGEEIGFLDTSLIVSAAFARQLLVSPDTMTLDSALYQPDSIKAPQPDLNSIYIDLMLFTEESQIQYLTDYSREDPRMIRLVFARSLTDTFSYSFTNTRKDQPLTFLEHFSEGRDSLTLWIRDSLYYKQDTLTLAINYTAKDTANRYVTQSDTLILAYREKTTKKKKDGKIPAAVEKLQLSTIKDKGIQELNGNLVIESNFPIDEIDDSRICLYRLADSVEVAEPFRVFRDSLLPARGWITAAWQSATNYRMVLLPGAVTSIYPPVHDTIDVTFATRDMEYYGKILLSLENVQERILIRIIRKDKVIRETAVMEPGQYIFDFLSPADYRIKFIHDKNGNGKWDTGNYLKKLQPEPVEYLPVTITVRSNWDHDVTMRLAK